MKRKMRSATIVLFVSLLFCTPSIQAQFTCEAKAPQEVAVGEVFTLTFSLNDKPNSLPKMNMSNFTVVSGPSVSSSSSMVINGGNMQRTYDYSCSYRLIAEKAGTYTIGEVSFSNGKEQTKSKPLTITVVNQQNKSASTQSAPGQNQRSSQREQAAGTSGFNKNDYFIRATISNSNPYVGQQVIVHYKLYTPAAGRWQGSATSMPTATNCWTYELGDRNAEPRHSQETINGKRYIVSDLKSIAVFPQKEGFVTISPLEATLQVQVVVQQQSTGDPFFDMFFNGGLQQVQMVDLPLKSNVVKINAKKLPNNNQPADFSGLVGDFSIKSELSRNQLPANDATNLKITISGGGNLQYINAPTLNLPNDIIQHEPQITDNIRVGETGVSGSRTFEYILIARNPGKYTLEGVPFNFYSPGKKAYQTIVSQGFDLQIDKAVNGESTVLSSANKEEVKQLGQDIRYIKEKSTLKKAQSPFFASFTYWTLLLLPILALILFVLFMRKKIKEGQNLVLVRDKRAAKQAKKRLKKAEKYLQEKNEAQFYIEISQVLWGYVSDKFHIPLSQLSFDTAKERLEQTQMSTESLDTFLETLNQCESARFAQSSEITMEKMYQKSFDFITRIEQQIKKK